jgi:hypothetical protein
MTLCFKTDSIGIDGGKPKNYNSIESLVVPLAEVDTNTQQMKRTRRSYVLVASIAFVVIAALLSLNFQHSYPTAPPMVELFKASITDATSADEPSQKCPPIRTETEDFLSIRSSGRDIIPVDVGAGTLNSFTIDDLLKGYKVTSEKPLTEPLFNISDQFLLLEAVRSSVAKSSIIKSSTDLNEVLSISGKMTVSLGPISGEGSASYLSKSISTKKSTVITYVDKQVMYQIKAKDHGLKPTNQLLDMMEKRDMLPIYDKYGTMVVSAIQYGCSLYARFEIISNSDVVEENIVQTVKAKIGKGYLSKEFKKEFSEKKGEKKQNYNMNVYVSTIGVNSKTINTTNDIDSFGEAFEVIQAYNQSKNELLAAHEHVREVFDLTNVSLQYSPIAAELDKLDNYVELPDVDQNIATYIKTQAGLTGKVLQDTHFLYEQVEKDSITMEANYDGAEDDYEPFREAVKDAKAYLDQKLSECSTYLNKTVSELYCHHLKAPEGVDGKILDMISNMFGSGYQKNPWGYNKNLYFEGIVIESNGIQEPWYEGYVKCEDNDYDVFGKQKLRVLKDLLQDNPDPKCGI